MGFEPGSESSLKGMIEIGSFSLTGSSWLTGFFASFGAGGVGIFSVLSPGGIARLAGDERRCSGFGAKVFRVIALEPAHRRTEGRGRALSDLGWGRGGVHGQEHPFAREMVKDVWVKGAR